MLTFTSVRNARAGSAARKVSDGQGLYLHITPRGSKSFRFRYVDPATGREQTLTFGLWPEVSIEDARARRDAARAQLRRGEDPRARVCEIAQTRTFEAAARAWHAHHLAGWSPVHAADVIRSLERDVFPTIGAEALDAVTSPRVLELLRKVEGRQARDTARRIRLRISLVFDFAAGEGWTTIANPAGVRGNLTRAPSRRPQPALVEVDELRALVRAVAGLKAAPIIILASHFLALTAVRLGALRGMRWCEVESPDETWPVWRVPAARMKLYVDQKADETHDHLVPLSAAARGVLSAARALAWKATGAAPAPDALVFPSPRDRSGATPIGEGAIGALYRDTPFAGRHVPHGWRASFSTVMNERRPADRAAIDLTLAHKPRGGLEERAMTKVEGAYNRAVYLPLRRALLEEWGALIAPGTPT